MSIKHINGQSTRDYVLNLLRQDIMEMTLKPGASISEKEISEKLEVSRTPVREAFLQLSQEGLLEIYPQKGTYVSLIDWDLAQEARFMRAELEKAVVKLACENFPAEKLAAIELNLKLQHICMKENNDTKLHELDEEFHRLIFEGCQKPRVWEAIKKIKTHLDRVRLLRLKANTFWEHVVDQHYEIFQAISEKNEAKAVEAMQKHLTQVIEDKKELESQYPNFFK